MGDFSRDYFPQCIAMLVRIIVKVIERLVSLGGNSSRKITHDDLRADETLLDCNNIKFLAHSHLKNIGNLVVSTYYLLENDYDHDKRKLFASKSFDRAYLPERGC